MKKLREKAGVKRQILLHDQKTSTDNLGLILSRYGSVKFRYGRFGYDCFGHGQFSHGQFSHGQFGHDNLDHFERRQIFVNGVAGLEPLWPASLANFQDEEGRSPAIYQRSTRDRTVAQIFLRLHEKFIFQIDRPSCPIQAGRRSLTQALQPIATRYFLILRQ